MSIILVCVFVAENILFVFFLFKYIRTVNREYRLKENELKLKADADFLQIATASLKERLAVTENMYGQDRAMRHDRRHFEAMLLMLIREGNVEKACKCLEERLEREPQPMVKYCGNITINAALSYYVSMAEKKHIKTNIAVLVPDNMGDTEVALAIAISNLFENAIHACMELPTQMRIIQISANYKSQLILEVANTCKEKVPLDKEGHPFTDKKDHGIGTRSILAFVGQTGSTVKYIAEEDWFRVRMIVNI